MSVVNLARRPRLVTCPAPSGTEVIGASRGLELKAGTYEVRTDGEVRVALGGGKATMLDLPVTAGSPLLCRVSVGSVVMAAVGGDARVWFSTVDEYEAGE